MDTQEEEEGEYAFLAGIEESFLRGVEKLKKSTDERAEKEAMKAFRKKYTRKILTDGKPSGFYVVH